MLIMLLAQMLTACGGSEDRKQKYFEHGMELYEKGDYLKARVEFRKVLHIDPQDVNAHYMFGLIEEKEENWKDAYVRFLKVVELDPQYTDVHVHLGKLYIYYDEAENALEEAEVALKFNPHDVTAMVLKGQAHFLLRQEESAINVAQTALDLDPDNIDAISLIAELYASRGELGHAIELVKAGIKKHPEHAAFHLLLARLYEKTGKSDCAIELLVKLIQLQPGELQHRLRLASFYMKNKRQHDAEQVLQNAIVDLPATNDPKLALVQMLSEQGKKEQAEIIIKQFIEQSPSDYDLQLGLASQYLQSDRVDEAKEVLQRVIKLAEDSNDGLIARNRLAALLLIDEKMNQALRMANKVLTLDPINKEALMMRATIALETDAPDACLTDLRILLKEYPNYVEAYRLKARAHLMKSDIGRARQSLEDAIQMQPQEIEDNVESAKLLVKSGNLDDAIIVLEKIRELAPDNLIVLQRLLDIYSAQQRWEQVSQTAHTLIEQYPYRGLGYYYVGLALQGMNKHKAAIKEFEQSLKITSDKIEPLIGIARSQLALGQTEEAVSMLRAGYDSSMSMVLGMELAILLDQSGKSDEAIRVYQGLLVQKPDFSVAANNLAMILLRGDPDKAALDKALELVQDFENSDNPVFLDTLGWVWVKQQDLGKAVAVLERAVRMRPALPEADYHLGVVYYGLGRIEDAKRYLEKAMASGDRFPEKEQAKNLLDEMN
jgi:tetratricopeptide (TPR) repeat protein